MCSSWWHLSFGILSDSKASRKSRSLHSDGYGDRECGAYPCSSWPALTRSTADIGPPFPERFIDGVFPVRTHLGVVLGQACSFLRFPIIRYRTIFRKLEMAKEMGSLSFQLEARGGQAVEAPPKQAIDEHHDRRHNERRSQPHIEAPGLAVAADGAAETRGRNKPSLKV